MGDLNFSIDGSNLVDGLDFGTETSMHTENFVINNGSQRKIVKDFCAVFPRIRVSILPVNFIIESIDGGNLSRLVVSSQESNSVRMLHF